MENTSDPKITKAIKANVSGDFIDNDNEQVNYGNGIEITLSDNADDNRFRLWLSSGEIKISAEDLEWPFGLRQGSKQIWIKEQEGSNDVCII